VLGTGNYTSIAVLKPQLMYFCPFGSQHQNMSIAVLTAIDGFFAREVEKSPQQG